MQAAAVQETADSVPETPATTGAAGVAGPAGVAVARAVAGDGVGRGLLVQPAARAAARTAMAALGTA